MIEATQTKLREAQFFLGHLAEEAEATAEREAFPFYLSAFLSAGRSVTFALQSEEKEKYDAWFLPWLGNLSKDDQKIFGLMKTQRNVSEKRGGAEVSVEWKLVPITKIRVVTGHPAYGFYWAGPPGVGPPEVGRLFTTLISKAPKRRSLPSASSTLGFWICWYMTSSRRIRRRLPKVSRGAAWQGRLKETALG